MTISRREVLTGAATVAAAAVLPTAPDVVTFPAAADSWGKIKVLFVSWNGSRWVPVSDWSEDGFLVGLPGKVEPQIGDTIAVVSGLDGLDWVSVP